MFGAFYDSKIRNHIVDAASMPSLFYIILNDFVEKRNGTQVSPQLQSKWSDQPKIQVQGRMQSKQCPTRRALAVGLKHAGLLPPRSPGQWRLLRVPLVAHATRSGSGKVCSSNSSSRTSRTSSSSSSSDKTRPGKTTHVFPAILWRYPGDTLKWKKRTPRHQSPSSFQHNHISKFQKGKTQHNPIPNGPDTLGKFQTCKNAGKSINNKNHVFQTQAGRRTHRLPQFFPPN